MYILTIDNQNHPYRILRSKKRKKSLSLKISQGGELEVRSPLFVQDDEIHHWLLNRRPWIKKQLTSLLQQSTFEKISSYLPDQTHYFLGMPYRLKIQCCEKNVEAVEIKGQNLLIQLSSPHDPQKVEHVIWQWYREQAVILFRQRFRLMVLRLPWVRSMPKMTIRKMKSRWGSCSSTGNISLNLHLIRGSLECLDQVILHELCHLKFFNHSPQFYALMAQYNPLYKDHEKKLKRLSIQSA